MRHTLAIAARELRERWILFPASFAIGCIPLVIPAFGVRRDNALVIGVASAFLLGATAAVVIGSSMLARDAALGRLGFLFSRPVSWRAIWGGKWLAALVLVFGSGLLAAIPWMAFYPPPNARGGSWLAALADGPGAVWCLSVAVLAVGLANFNATAFRSRSTWLVLDLLLLMAAVWAVRAYVAPMLWYGFFAGFWTPHLAAATLGLALLAGSAAQVAYGRTDLRRAHRALSLGAWVLVWVAFATAAGVVFWVRAARPADLNAFAVTRDPGGRWVYVEGPARTRSRYPSAYLIDSTTGRFLRAPDDRSPLGFASGVLFSGDGRVAARPVPDPDQRGTALALFDLTAAAPVPATVELEKSPPLEPWNSAFSLSANGRLVFYVHASGASLYELPSGRRVATTPLLPGFRPAATRFIGDGSARVWLIPSESAAPRSEMRVVDLAASGAAIRSFATAVRLTGWGALVVDASGSRIVTLDEGLRLRDGADGRLIATLSEGNGTPAPRAAVMLAAAFLADGRVVTADGTAPAAVHPRVTVFDAAGAPLGQALVPLSPTGLTVGPELAAGRVVLSSSLGSWPYAAGESLVFDANARRVVQTLSGLRPAVGFFMTPAVPAAAPVSPVQLFRDTDGRVLRVDTTTGERQTVAGPGAPAGERLPWR